MYVSVECTLSSSDSHCSVVFTVNLNLMINQGKQKIILGKDGLSAYIAKYTLWFIYIANKEIYFTISKTHTHTQI